jgi:hypothetical protein
LWKSSDDFGVWELVEGTSHYYVWFDQLGWVYADKIKDGFRPNEFKGESLLVSY